MGLLRRASLSGTSMIRMNWRAMIVLFGPNNDASYRRQWYACRLVRSHSRLPCSRERKQCSSALGRQYHEPNPGISSLCLGQSLLPYASLRARVQRARGEHPDVKLGGASPSGVEMKGLVFLQRTSFVDTMTAGPEPATTDERQIGIVPPEPECFTSHEYIPISNVHRTRRTPIWVKEARTLCSCIVFWDTIGMDVFTYDLPVVS